MWGNKKLRLESIKIQSGYETDLSPQIKPRLGSKTLRSGYEPNCDETER
jgi:hypothetical protein